MSRQTDCVEELERKTKKIAATEMDGHAGTMWRKIRFVTLSSHSS